MVGGEHTICLLVSSIKIKVKLGPIGGDTVMGHVSVLFDTRGVSNVDSLHIFQNWAKCSLPRLHAVSYASPATPPAPLSQVFSNYHTGEKHLICHLVAAISICAALLSLNKYIQT